MVRGGRGSGEETVDEGRIDRSIGIDAEVGSSGGGEFDEPVELGEMVWSGEVGHVQVTVSPVLDPPLGAAEGRLGDHLWMWRGSRGRVSVLSGGVRAFLMTFASEVP